MKLTVVLENCDKFMILCMMVTGRRLDGNKWEGTFHFASPSRVVYEAFDEEMILFSGPTDTYTDTKNAVIDIISLTDIKQATHKLQMSPSTVPTPSALSISAN